MNVLDVTFSAVAKALSNVDNLPLLVLAADESFVMDGRQI